ncbi:MAG: PTS system nitrogen regulatory IIA component [Kiritimatiellia bacterium]|jgi:PTS system nitrogen regulatory IIA component
MNISSLLSPKSVLCLHNSSSKKRILEDISEHLGGQFPGINANTIFSALISREKLGSTGIGNGIAIPHCRIPECNKIIAMLITLEKSIDFDAIDSRPVDVIFVLLVPEDANENHLKTLAKIAETFSDEKILSSVRHATNNDELLQAVQST